MKIRIPQTTPSCYRALCRLSRTPGDSAIQPADLIDAILAEESLGSRLLTQLGFTVDFKSTSMPFASQSFSKQTNDLQITENLATPPDSCRRDASPVIEFRGGEWLEPLLERATVLCRRMDDAAAVSTELLVDAMSQTPGPARQYLAKHNIVESDIQKLLQAERPPETQALPVDFDLDLDDPTHTTTNSKLTNFAPKNSELAQQSATHNFSVPQPQTGIWTAIDANLNRAREGLRVLDDCARFVLRNVAAMQLAKQLRHSLVTMENRLRQNNPPPKNSHTDNAHSNNASPQDARTLSRDVQADPGTNLTLPTEAARENITALITANARRVQEALRSLEEFGKLLDGHLAQEAKQLRYQAYSVEQQLLLTEESYGENHDRRMHLQSSQLYVLVTEALCVLPWKTVVTEIIDGGVNIIQLREKFLSDATFAKRGQWIAAACQEAHRLFIVNDRAHLVAETQADGVHVGQHDTDIVQARTIVGPDRLLGLSTHQPSQLQDANQTSADYVGVGPMFTSSTKEFTEFPGIEYARHAAEHSQQPAFAIGGIGLKNVERLMDVGIRRIAVCAAVISTDDPKSATGDFSKLLADQQIVQTANRQKTP